MFLPRKLQKHVHPGGTAATSGNAQEDEHEATSAHGQNSARQIHQHSSSPYEAVLLDADSVEGKTIPPTQHNSETRHQARGSDETAKLDRLGEFLFLRLSPLYLALAVNEDDPAVRKGWSDLVASITGNSEDGGSTQSGSKVHLARLLQLIPGLPTRCKSISLLSDALQLLRNAPAAGWFSLQQGCFQLEWSPSYCQLVRQFCSAKSPMQEALAPRLVYIESIPPKYRTRTQAAQYICQLLPGNPAVLSVLEPGVVEEQLMSSTKTLPNAAVLEGRWVSGRGFMLLDSAQNVDALCERYTWDLAERIERKRMEEPIRCLSWAGWVELKRLYLECCPLPV